METLTPEQWRSVADGLAKDGRWQDVARRLDIRETEAHDAIGLLRYLAACDFTLAELAVVTRKVHAETADVLMTVQGPEAARPARVPVPQRGGTSDGGGIERRGKGERRRAVPVPFDLFLTILFFTYR